MFVIVLFLLFVSQTWSCSQIIETVCFQETYGTAIVLGPPYDQKFPPTRAKTELIGGPKYKKIFFGVNCFPKWADDGSIQELLPNITDMYWAHSECEKCIFAPNTTKEVTFHERDKCKTIEPTAVPLPKEKKGQHLELKIVLPVGAVAILGAVGLLIYKKFKKPAQIDVQSEE